MTAPILSIRSPEAIAQAVELLQDGQLVIIPTDTIYGIAALSKKEAAIRRLYEVRERLPEPASPFLLANADDIDILAFYDKPLIKFDPSPKLRFKPRITHVPGSPPRAQFSRSDAASGSRRRLSLCQWCNLPWRSSCNFGT